MSIDSFNPHKRPLSGSYHYPHSTEGETETQRFEKLPKGHATSRQVSWDLTQADWPQHCNYKGLALLAERAVFVFLFSLLHIQEEE